MGRRPRASLMVLWAKGLWALGGPTGKQLPDTDPGRARFLGEASPWENRCWERCMRVSAYNKPPWRREVLRGKGQGQNRTWEIRPSGIVGGPWETEPMAEMGSHLATESARLGTLCLRAAAPQIYPAQRARGPPH